MLVVVDTLRADHLGAYGGARPTSPRFDRLAAAGTLFENAWSAAPWTLPSVMSILTGRHPSGHRVENDGLFLGEEVPTLAELLHGRGYATAAFVSHVYVSRPFGFARGFDTFEDFGVSRPDYRLEGNMEPDAGRVTDAAIAWIEERARAPRFLLVHYFDPHWPYAAPGPDRDRFTTGYDGPLGADYDSLSRFQDETVPMPPEYLRFLIERYDGEIAWTDRQLGRLLDAVARRRRAAWVIVTADHGEEFRDHGSMGHGRRLYEESIHVPLVVAPLGSPAAAASRVAEPVGAVDILPTVLDLTGTAGPPDLPGRSLVRFLKPAAAPAAEAPSEERSLVSETIRLGASRKAIRQGSLKLIHAMDTQTHELYDLGGDPGERRNLYRTRPAESRRLIRALFAETDFLSGGWNVRWSSDGREHRFEGRIVTEGAFRAIVPLLGDAGTYEVRGSTITFRDPGQRGEGGLSFTVAPYEAAVEFRLLVDGRAGPGNVKLGGRAVHPSAMPFSLAGDPDSAAAFARPPHRPGIDLGFFMWRVPPVPPGRAVILDDEIKERLRSLGYID